MNSEQAGAAGEMNWTSFIRPDLHTRYATDENPRAKPRKVEEIWKRERELGRGIATVWLEKCATGPGMVGKRRAVKIGRAHV